MYKLKLFIKVGVEVETFNNTTKVVKDDLEKKIQSGSKLSVAAACFSIYAYQALKKELEK